MNLSEARQVLLIQSIEEVDETGAIFSASDRSEAAAVAGAPLPPESTVEDQERFFVDRAGVLMSRLTSRNPDAAHSFNQTPIRQFPPYAVWFLFLIAAVVGYFSNELGPENHINILSFPLLGIIAWNLIVYLREAVLLLRRRLLSSDEDFGSWLISEKRSIAEEDSPDHEGSTRIAEGRSRFNSRWLKILSPIYFSRFKAILHRVALVLAFSAIAGMYVNGLANEYRAVWESTFFEDASQLRPLLNAVLGPAAAITGDAIPTVEALNAIRWTDGSDALVGENAARWIHWYAITIMLFVLIPRAILGQLWKLKSQSLERNVAYRCQAPKYFEHLISVSSGAAKKVFMIPYSLDVLPHQRAIQEALEEEFHCPLSIEWGHKIEFGEEEEGPEGLAVGESLPIPIFSFAATPESETHLALYETLASSLPAKIPYVVLETSSFEKTNSSLLESAKRRDGRSEAWKRLFSHTEVTFILTRSPQPVT
ncbi:MAG: DUF2868 domain-containing protein [Verrucomicrobiota bacterium]